MSERVVTVGGPDPTRLLSEFDRNIAGTEFYVGPNATGAGDDGRSGRSKESSMATLEAALALVTASKGDIEYLLPGHAETIVTAIDLNKIGMNLIGLGNGKLRPALTCNAAIDCITVTAANVRIQNIYFPASTLTAVTARINVAAANCVIENCVFEVGEFDLETITIAAGGDDLIIRDCQFISNSAGEGDAAIEIEAAGVDGLQVIGCHFDGYDDVQAWDTGAINSGAAHTRCLIRGNTTLYGPGIIFSAAATGMIVDNCCTEGTLGSMIDPGSCMCIGNYESDAVDETGSLFPQTSPVGGGLETDVAAILADTAAISMRCVEKAADVLTGADDIFVISGGPVRAKLVGIVTTVIGGASNAKITMTTTDPAATLDLSAGAVAIDTDAKGTSYHHVAATAVFTPLTEGAAVIDPVTVDETYFILPIGTVHFHNSAAQTGEVTWYMTYEALSPSSVVAAAA